MTDPGTALTTATTTTADAEAPEPEESEEEELELDLEDDNVRLAMEMSSSQIKSLHLNNDVIYQVNSPWPSTTDPAQPGIRMKNDKGEDAVDDKGNPLWLKVGAIFFIEEAATAVQDPANGEVSTSRFPAHYEVWSEPDPNNRVARRKRIFLDHVIEAEDEVSMAWASDQIMTDRLPDQLLITIPEVMELAEKIKEARAKQNGS